MIQLDFSNIKSRKDFSLKMAVYESSSASSEIKKKAIKKLKKAFPHFCRVQNKASLPEISMSIEDDSISGNQSLSA